MFEFIYLFTTLLIIIFVLYLLKYNQNKCPKKIRNFYNITFFIVLLRYCAIITCMLLDKVNIAYHIRFLTLLNYIYVPLLALVALYIFLRDEKRTFNYNYIFCALLVLNYIFLNYKFTIDISINNIFGIVIAFKEVLIPALIFLIIISMLAMVSLIYIDKPFSNKLGMSILTIVLMLNIGEIIAMVGGISLFPYTIIGESLLLATNYVAINTFKNK